MNLINALAISIGTLAAVATYLCLGTSFGLQLWALFLGWGSFYHSGGGTDGLQKSAVNHALGAVLATITLIVIGVSAGPLILTSILVGISVVILVLFAHLPVFATIPAGVYGYASTAAFILLTGVALVDVQAMVSAGAMVLVSLVLGNVFGIVSEKIGGALAKTAAEDTTEAA